MSENQNIANSKSLTKKQLLERLQDIEWDNFEVKTARTDVPKDVWETVFGVFKYFGRLDCVRRVAKEKNV